jgi:hypothetical protein
MDTTDLGNLAALALGFPDWHIWRSRDSRGRDADWNATRRTKPQAAPGVTARVTAADADGLRGLLEQQRAAEAAQQPAYAA